MRRSFLRLGALALAGLFVGLAAHAPRAEALSCFSTVPAHPNGYASPTSHQDLLWGDRERSVTAEGSTVAHGRYSLASTRDRQFPTEVAFWAPDPPLDPALRYVVKHAGHESFRFTPSDSPPPEVTYAVSEEVEGSFVKLRLEGIGLLLADTQHGREFDEERLEGIVDAIDANEFFAPGSGIPLGYRDCEQRGILAPRGSTLDLSVGIVRIDGTFLGWERRSINIPELEEPGGCGCVNGRPSSGWSGLVLLGMFLLGGRRSARPLSQARGLGLGAGPLNSGKKGCGDAGIAFRKRGAINQNAA